MKTIRVISDNVIEEIDNNPPPIVRKLDKMDLQGRLLSLQTQQSLLSEHIARTEDDLLKFT